MADVDKYFAFIIIFWDDASGAHPDDPDTAGVFGIYYSQERAEREYDRILRESDYTHGEQIELATIPIWILDHNSIIEDSIGKPATERLYDFLAGEIWSKLMIVKMDQFPMEKEDA